MFKQKLTNEQKQVIVKRFKAGESIMTLAKEYGVSYPSYVKTRLEKIIKRFWKQIVLICEQNPQS